MCIRDSYVGCTHGCKYCYASFMKRFTGHTEPWGTFLDVKHWPEIKNPQKYRGQRVVIGSVTDGYLPQEEQFQNTRKLLEQLKDLSLIHIWDTGAPNQRGFCHPVPRMPSALSTPKLDIGYHGRDGRTA